MEYDPRDTKNTFVLLNTSTQGSKLGILVLARAFSSESLDSSGGEPWGGGSPGEKGRMVYGRREKGGGNWDFQGSGKRENAQYFAIAKSAKRRKPTKIGQEPELKRTESGKFKPPLSPTTQWPNHVELDLLVKPTLLATEFLSWRYSTIRFGVIWRLFYIVANWTNCYFSLFLSMR